MRKKNINFCLLLLIFMFFYIFKCNFVKAEVTSHAGTGSFGGITGSGGGGSGPNFLSNGFIGYRFTLVDENGKKIADTNSVDYIHSDSEGDIIKTGALSFSLNGRTYNEIRGSSYDYRFSDWGDGYGTNAVNKYLIFGSKFITPSMTSNMNSASTGVLQFIDTYIVDYKSHNDFCSKMWDNNLGCSGVDKIDFISLFLHHSGYMAKTDGNSFEEMSNRNSDKYLKLISYYLAVEPLFAISNPNVYGTGYEFIKSMYEGRASTSGSWYTIEQNIAERSFFGCSFYTLPSFSEVNSKLFKNYFNNTSECMAGSFEVVWKGLCSNSISETFGLPVYCGYEWYNNNLSADNVDLTNYMKNQKDSASGVSMISLRDIIESFDMFSLELCNNNSVSFTTKIKPNFGKSLDKYYTYESSGVDGKNINCYDDVTFKYSNLMESIQNVQTIDTTLVFGDITATVKRTCDGETAEDMSKKVERDYSKGIKVNVYGKTLTFNLSSVVRRSGDAKAGRFDLVYKYKEDPNENTLAVSRKLLGSNLNKEMTAYIDFSDYKNMVGASSNVLKNMLAGNNSNCKKKENEYYSLYNKDTKCLTPEVITDGSLKVAKTAGVNVIDPNSTGGRCSFKYKVEGDSEQLTAFKYRQIALDNPFPARNGTSRLPGLNWLNTKNNVFEYITNNRGIRYYEGDSASPESMYTSSSIEPMYTVTLTPSTMIKIRDYNRRYSYYSMFYTTYTETDAGENETRRQNDRGADKLRCNSNGRECYSEFLRKQIPASDLSGVCVISKDLGNVRSMMNAIAFTADSEKREDIYEIVSKSLNSYNIDLDYNKNRRLDQDDYIVSLEKNSSKNTKFYSCADKTFLSGGAYEDGEY